MADGLSVANLANAWLNTVRGTSFSIGATWAQLHIGTPGANGTSNLSAVTTRQQVTFAVAANGALALATTPQAWNMTANETITDISIWSANSSGTFYWSAPLTVAKTVANGDTLTLNTCGLSLSPLAA